MWQSILNVLGLIALDLGMLVSLVLIPLGLPGNFLLLGLAVLAAWIGSFQTIGWLALVVIAALIVAAEVVEAMLGSVFARRYGASWWGVLGAFAGGIAGMIVGSAILPLVGSLIGAFLGAALGAVLLEAGTLRRVDAEALRAGWGAFLGKLTAAILKVSLGMGIALFIVLRTH